MRFSTTPMSKYAFRSERAALVWLLFLSAGCATTYTNLSDPHALKPGHVEVSLAGQAFASTTPLQKSISSASVLYKGATSEADDELSRADAFNLADGALSWLLLSPSADPELLARVGLPSGPFPGFDIGFRIGPTVAKLDAKWQFFESANGRRAMALQAAYGFQFAGPRNEVEWLALSDFGRHDVDLMATWGWRLPDILEVYLGPRLLASFLTVKPKLESDLVDELPAEMSQFNPSRLFTDTQIVNTGATAGIKAGYKHLFARVELNSFYMWFRPTVLGQPRNFDGAVFSPSVAITGSF